MEYQKQKLDTGWRKKNSKRVKYETENGNNMQQLGKPTKIPPGKKRHSQNTEVYERGFNKEESRTRYKAIHIAPN